MIARNRSNFVGMVCMWLIILLISKFVFSYNRLADGIYHPLFFYKNRRKHGPITNTNQIIIRLITYTTSETEKSVTS